MMKLLVLAAVAAVAVAGGPPVKGPVKGKGGKSASCNFPTCLEELDSTDDIHKFDETLDGIGEYLTRVHVENCVDKLNKVKKIAQCLCTLSHYTFSIAQPHAPAWCTGGELATAIKEVMESQDCQAVATGIGELATCDALQCGIHIGGRRLGGSSENSVNLNDNFFKQVLAGFLNPPVNQACCLLNLVKDIIEDVKDIFSDFRDLEQAADSLEALTCGAGNTCPLVDIKSQVLDPSRACCAACNYVQVIYTLRKDICADIKDLVKDVIKIETKCGIDIV